MRVLFVLIALIPGLAFAQSPGNLQLVGPSDGLGIPQVTPSYLNRSINPQFAAKVDTNNGMLNNPTISGMINGISVGLSVPTVTALRANILPWSSINLQGYSVSGDGGGGDFALVSGSCSDNGGTLIVDAASHCYKRNYSGPINLLWFGADPTGTATATTAINNALAASAFSALSIPAGTYKIDAALTCPNPFNGSIIGAGSPVAEILQTNLTADVLDCNAAFGSLKIAGLTIKGNSPHFNSPGSTGTALYLTDLNQPASLNDIRIQNMDVGIRLAGSFSVALTNITVDYFQTAALWIDATSATNGIDLSHFNFENNDFVKADGTTPNTPATYANPLSANSQIGILEQRSGGNFFSFGDITEAGSALALQPSAGQAVQYDKFTSIFFDTSNNDNIVIDQSNAGSFVDTINFNNSWGAFSTNGSGINCIAGDQIFWNGGNLRQNGVNGAHIHLACQSLYIDGAQIADNNKLNVAAGPSAGHGVLVDAGAVSWGVSNSFVGNTGHSTWSQCDGILALSGAGNNISIIGNQGGTFGAGCSPWAISATGSNVIIRDNTPIGANNPTGYFSGATSSTIAASTLVYIGSGGSSATETAVAWTTPSIGQITIITCSSVAPPGAGQSFTYVLDYNNAPTAWTGTISGASQFTVTFFAAQLSVAAGASFDASLQTSSGAASTYHRCVVGFSGA